MGTVLSTGELRQNKLGRVEFRLQKRRPIWVVLDGVRGNYNIGALFRLCDAMLLEKLSICNNPEFFLRNRRVVQAAKGTHKWVPWEQVDSTEECINKAKAAGYQIAAIELTSNSIAPQDFKPKFPLCLVVGEECAGVSPSIVAQADVCLSLPMHGMANSMNLATASAIVFHEICKNLG